MPPLSLLIKPVSSLCNLRCKYCFYHSLAENRKVGYYGTMSADTLETIVKKAFLYADKICIFAFQGGEPTLAGLDFYKNFIGYVKKYNTKNINVSCAIQTNGTLIDDEWAKFFFENKFLVGISLDGPKDIHNYFRYDANGSSLFIKVMEAIKLLNKYKVEYNILSVVTSYSARHVQKIYNFFKKNNFKFLQFIPCLDPLDEKNEQDYSLTNEKYTLFLKLLFDLWYEDIKIKNMISIRLFDSFLGTILRYPPDTCGTNGICSANLVIEADGSVFPCDFYVLDKWLLGNINENNFGDILNSKIIKEFINESYNINPECEMCRFNKLCKGGCKRYKEPLNGKNDKNNYCLAYKNFFEYAEERLFELANLYKNAR